MDWTPVDGPLTLKYTGGGGTCHNHMAQYVQDMDEPPACIVTLTDGETRLTLDPGVPLLWVVTKDGNHDLPYGRTIVLE